MEDFKKDLKLCELKSENLRKTFEQAKAQVEKHFDLLELNIEKSLAELKFQEQELEAKVTTLREKQEEIVLKENELISLSEKIEECSREFSSKNEELSVLSKNIDLLSESCEGLEGKKKQLSSVEEELRKSNEDKCNELNENERKLESIKSLIQDYEEELEAKRDEYEGLEKSIRVRATKLDYKEKELRSIEEKISDCLRELDSKDDDLDSLLKSIRRKEEQLESAEKELDSKENSIRRYSEDVELKKHEFVALGLSIKERSQELRSKEDQLSSVQVSIEGCTNKLRAKEEELTSIKDSILECIKELESKQKSQEEISGVIASKEKQVDLVKKECAERLEKVDVMEKSVSSLERSLQERLEKFETEKRQFESKEKLLDIAEKAFNERLLEADAKEKRLSSLERSSAERLEKFETEKRHFESKEKLLDIAEKACNGRLQEADAKEKRLSLLERSLAERSEEFETENREFEARVKEFEMRKKQFDSVQKAVEQRSMELELREKELTDHLHTQVSNENPSSFFPQAFGITNTESVNPVIPNQIKTEPPDHFTMFNATDVPMETDFQSIGDVHLNYEPYLRKNEVLSDLQMSRDPAKFVLDVMQGISSEHKKKGGTGFEESFLEISLLMLEQLLHVSPQVQPKVKADALELAKEWKAKMNLNAENSIEILGFLQFVAAFGLVSYFNKDEIFKLLRTTAHHQQARNVCRLLGVTDMIPGFVCSLIARKQYIEAVRFVCAFDCKDEFPPKNILSQYFQDVSRVAGDRCVIGKNLPEVQQKATDEQIAALKSIIECVKDCKLESCVSVKVIGECIVLLEDLKMNMTLSAPAPAPAPAVQPNVHSLTTYYNDPSVPENQPSHVPAVQGQFHASPPGTQPQQQLQRMDYSSIPGTQLQGLSNKRPRADGIVSPHVHPTSSPHGLDIPNPYNQGAIHFGLATNKEPSSTSATRQSNVTERNYPIHNKPDQQ